ncbi:hypothetical protein PAXRUDRAFT_178952, partial [Paxillus rubicundulus Ve08.2h10]
KQSWDEEWIDEAILVTHAVYVYRYKGKTSCPKETSAATAPESTEKQKSNTFWGFGNYSLGPDTAAQETIDKLDDCLLQPIEKVENVLKWWT